MIQIGQEERIRRDYEAGDYQSALEQCQQWYESCQRIVVKEQLREEKKEEKLQEEKICALYWEGRIRMQRQKGLAPRQRQEELQRAYSAFFLALYLKKGFQQSLQEELVAVDMEMENYRRAADRAQQILIRDPDCLHMMCQRQYACYRLGEQKNVTDMYERIQRADPKNVWNYRICMQIWQKEHRYERALQVYEDAVNAGIEDAFLHVQSVICLAQAKKQDTKELWKRLCESKENLEYGRNDPQTQAELAYAIALLKGVLLPKEEQDLQLAKQRIEEALDFEKRTEFVETKGRIASEEGDYALAAQCFQFCEQTECLDKEGYLRLGELFFHKLKQEKEGIVYFEKALHQDPEDEELTQFLYENYWKYARHGQEPVYYEKALELISYRKRQGKVKEHEIWCEQAKIYLEMGKRNKAKGLIEDGLRVCRTDARLWYLKGEILKLEKKVDEALPHFLMAMECLRQQKVPSQKEMARAKLAIASSYAMEGELKKAKEWYEFEIGPVSGTDYEEYYTQIFEFYLRVCLYQEARACNEQAKEAGAFSKSRYIKNAYQIRLSEEKDGTVRRQIALEVAQKANQDKDLCLQKFAGAALYYLTDERERGYQMLDNVFWQLPNGHWWEKREWISQMCEIYTLREEKEKAQNSFERLLDTFADHYQVKREEAEKTALADPCYSMQNLCLLLRCRMQFTIDAQMAEQIRILDYRNICRDCRCKYCEGRMEVMGLYHEKTGKWSLAYQWYQLAASEEPDSFYLQEKIRALGRKLHRSRRVKERPRYKRQGALMQWIQKKIERS